MLVKSLQEDGYYMVGYARISKNEEDGKTRACLLDHMRKNLREMSLMSKILATVSCSINEMKRRPIVANQCS
jgi:hypothetical protein